MTTLEPGSGTGVLAGDHRMPACTRALGCGPGGYKQSGLGRRNGEHGFEEYLEIKTIGLPGR